MIDDQPTRSLGEGDAPASSLRGLTRVLGLEPAQPGHDPLLGCDIGGVTIVRLIAEGGMGRVYEGKQEKPKRTVAVKVMRPGLTSASLLKRFEYEAEVLGRLQHPGIAHIYSVGVHRVGNASVPYFIMEYIADARTLTQFARDSKLPTRQRLDLFRSVCDAVAHGHQKGVIHRDLKPSNILVDASGQPKVIDFGVARATDSDMALTTMQTDVGQLIGTLQYMSPEQFNADPNDIDIRSDVYALGVVLYELLAGKPPYDVKEKAIYEVMRIVKEDDPTPLGSLNQALRGDVAVIAAKCLEKERGRRYSSAGEVGADIGRYLSGDTITASPPTFFDGLRRLARKHRAATAAVAGILLALVLALVGITMFATRAERERKIAIEERDRANTREQELRESQSQAESARVTAEKARELAEERRARAEASEAVAEQERRNAAERLYEANLYQMQQLIKDKRFSTAKALYEEVAVRFDRDFLPIELRIIYSQCAGESLVSYDGHRGSLTGVAFSPDGTRLATASQDKSARLWDVASGKQLAVLEGHGEAVLAVVFSPDGTWLATASRDKTAQLWNVASAKQLAVLEGHGDHVAAVAFSPDGTRLATASSDTTARLWDAASGKQLAVSEGHGDHLTAVAFSPDGTRLATTSGDRTARLWDVVSGKQLAVLEGHGTAALAVAFSPDGTRLATASNDTTARLWDVASAKQLAVLEGHGDGVAAVAFSPDGTRLATSSWDKTVRLWDVVSGKQLAVLEGHGEAVLAVVFSPDGTWLATASRDKTARLWDVASAKQLAVLEGHGDHVAAVAFNPDGTRLATAGRDKTARLWDVASGKQLAVLRGHRSYIAAVAFSPDGTRLATASWDHTPRLWDVASGKPLSVLKGHGSSVWAVAFSPDGSRLATTNRDKTAQLWDVASGKQLTVLEGHGDAVLAVAFSPDGTRLATASQDKTARLWGMSKAEMYQARRETETIEHRLNERIATWLKDSPEAVIAKLQASKGDLTPEEYHVASNMVLSRLAAKSSATESK